MKVLEKAPEVLGMASEHSGAPSRRAGMDDADLVRAEMAGIVRLAAEPFLPRGVGYALGQAARLLGIKPRRAEAYWWGEVNMVPAWEADRMRARRVQLLLEREARLDRE